MNVSRLFLEPFKWDNMVIYTRLLGKGTELLNECT